LHGSQVVAYLSVSPDGIHKWVSTKNYNAEGLRLLESNTNFYWMALEDIHLFDVIADMVTQGSVIPSPTDFVVQVFGEAIPCQGLKYGFVNPTMKIFSVAVNGRVVPYDQLPESIRIHWVPILYDGPYTNVPELKKLALGNEQVSGQELHIKEGIVIRPYEDRRASDRTWLKVKVLNSEYKETGEEFN
jgi:RNA ligase (TIGR02306 family)